MITVLVPDPSFGAAYNMVPALRAWQDTRLISKRPDGFRTWDCGLLLDSFDNQLEAWRLIDASAFTLVVGVEGIKILQGIGDDRWIREKRVVAFMMGKRYWENGVSTNNLMADLKIDHLYVLPNLLDVAPKHVVPMLQPVAVPETVERPSFLTVMHAPGTPKKRDQKGTDVIERVVGKLSKDYQFDYRTVMWMDHAACLRIKQRAHIFIDQIPPEGQTRGLGMSGEEAMAAGSVVVTAMYDQSDLVEYWPVPPPVLEAYDADELETHLRKWMMLDSREELESLGKASRRWAVDNLSFGAWLAYFREHLPEELNNDG